jgi:asparagine synthase (glutamine-hydrolysing)
MTDGQRRPVGGFLRPSLDRPHTRLSMRGHAKREAIENVTEDGTVMCGICGLVERAPMNGGPAHHPGEAVRLMESALAHRGPDDAGHARGHGFEFGFRRLAILDLTGGNQPLASEDGAVTTVMNGEIYNFRELRVELEKAGHRFRTGTDAEVLPHLYEEYGIDGLKRLRGMFALAVWDSRRETVYLARDPFGIKPLYYAESSVGLLFSSEIRSLLASRLIAPEIRSDALWLYFTFQYVPDPMTLLAGVHKVPPGHYLRWRRGQSDIVAYGAPRGEDWASGEASGPDHLYAGRILEALRDSVQAHLLSDVPVGAYLSSGVDSSLVAALIRARQPVKTFSIGFEGVAPHLDELPVARETAARLETDHHEIRVTARDYETHLLDIVASQEEPVADPSAPALWFLAREARRHVTVVLSGEGADELFGGYPIYHEPLSLAPFGRLSPGLRAALGRVGLRLPTGLPGKSLLERQATPLAERFIGNAYLFSEAEKAQLLTEVPPAHRVPPTTVTGRLYQQVEHLDDTGRMQWIDLNLWLPGDILMKADKMSMAHALELRVPFLDREVFRVAVGLPLAQRVRRGITKYALRQAAAEVLPETIAHRPKLGFPVPYRQWLTGPLQPFVQDLLESSGGTEVDVRYARRLLTVEVPGSAGAARKFWAVLTFLLWRRAVWQEQGLLAACDE